MNLKKHINYLKRNKEGAILGAIVGYFMAFVYTKVLDGTDATFILQSQGVIDNILAEVQTPHVIYIKLAIFSILVGAFLGMVLDEQVRWL